MGAARVTKDENERKCAGMAHEGSCGANEWMGPVHNDHASCPADDEWQWQPQWSITEFRYSD